jgi:hypothetical protein
MFAASERSAHGLVAGTPRPVQLDVSELGGESTPVLPLQQGIFPRGNFIIGINGFSSTWDIVGLSGMFTWNR